MLFTKSASHCGHGAAVAKASGEGFWWRPDIARGRARLGAMRARSARSHRVETATGCWSERAMAYVPAPAALLGRLRVLAPAADDQLDDDPAIVGSIRWLLFSGQHGVC